MKVALVATLCVIALVALPASAFAANSPTGTTTTASQQIIWDTAGLSKALIKVNGVNQYTFTTATNAYAYAGPLTDGVKNVTTSSKVAGVVTSGPSWSFTVSVAPVIGAVTPGNNQVLSADPAQITAKASDNTAVTSVEATVNGSAATDAYANGTITITGFTTVNGWNSVQIAVHDAAGNTTTKAWGFSKLAAPLAAASCTKCHSGSQVGFGTEDRASGHNTTEKGVIGGKSKFDGTQGVTIWAENEVANPSMPATWLVEANFGWATAPSDWVGQAVAAGAKTPMETPWTFPTAQTFWATGATDNAADAIEGLTKDSVITCEDCHESFNATGPHGAGTNAGFGPDYPADYSLAELTKYVTSNNAFASATNSNPANTAQGWDDANNSFRQVVLRPGRVKTATPAVADYVKQDDPAAVGSQYFEGFASGIAVRPAIDGNGVGSYDAIDVSLRTDGTKGATAVICAKCHDLVNVVANGDGRSSAVGGNLAHNSHHQDATDSSAQCVSCHVGVTHGWKRPRLLVNTDHDAAPFLDPMYTGSSRVTTATGGTYGVVVPATVYRWNRTTNVWDALSSGSVGADGKITGAPSGFNVTKIGMQSLSAVDTHVAVKDHPDPAVSSPAGGLTTVNTDDMIYWAEPSCQACNDHGGEDGVRIAEE